MTHTQPFTPGRTGQGLRVVGSAATPDDPADGLTAAGPALASGGAVPPVVTARPGRTRRGKGEPGNVYPLRPVPAAAPSGRAHETYRHEGVFYAGTGGFLGAAVPFVRDGLARDQPVMVAVAEPRLSALRSALGPDADQVLFADMAELGRNPALIIPAWRGFTDQHGGPGHPVRGIGEPIWAGRCPAEIAEAQLHEALLNVAVSPDVPLWLLCPYDSTALDQQIITEAHRSHPVLVESGTYRGSTRYGGAVHVERLFSDPLPEPAPPTTAITVDRHRQGHLRRILRAAATAGVPLDRAVKLAAAIDELARAAIGASGQVDVRLWQEQTALVCEVTDPGTVDDPMIGRHTGPDLPRGRATRLANDLCDLVQIRSDATGTTTRIHTRSGAGGAGR